MAIPTSAITLTSIQGEFGGANPISLSEYYSGGGFVRPEVTAVAASGTISMGSFAGTSQILPNSPKTGIVIDGSTFKGSPLDKKLVAAVSTTANPNVGGLMNNQYFNVSSTYYNKRIRRFEHDMEGPFYFAISAGSGSNFGWTNINMVNNTGTYNLSRSTANFFTYSTTSQRAIWGWTSAGTWPAYEFLYNVSTGTSCTVTFS